MADSPQITIDSEHDGRLTLRIAGNWTLSSLSESKQSWSDKDLLERISAVHFLCFDISGVSEWDSSLIAKILFLSQEASKNGVIVDSSQLPKGISRLLALSMTKASSTKVSAEEKKKSLFHNVGKLVFLSWEKCVAFSEFLGLIVVLSAQTLVGRGGFDRKDLLYFVESCGVKALPIVGLISTLVGLILGFIGGLQLEQFGAQVYIANLVGIAMVREMGSMMVGIIMAGRTGAAFAAQLGTMQVNEEIDALETFGISSSNYLIMPRVIALVLMMPILSVYANLLGMLGGLAVGTTLYDVTFIQYIQQSAFSFAAKDFWIGIFKSMLYGLIVALSGCYRGFRCGRTAASVGDATTSAVVTAIVFIIVTDAIAAVICAALGV